ncbi:MAG: hypothetical protein JWR84_409 [Caulobacter sp.]|nr:hypothetical protein [Caulobacter sp.]
MTARTPFTTQVTTPSDREITVTRSVRAPRELVWRAYTDPALIPRWMLGPPGWSMPVCEIDARVGGAYRYLWRSDADGTEFGLAGVHREVDFPGQLVATQAFEPDMMGGESLVSSDFNETAAGVTTIVTTILYASQEIRDAAAASGMADGMEAGYQRLEGLLADVAA